MYIPAPASGISLQAHACITFLARPFMDSTMAHLLHAAVVCEVSGRIAAEVDLANICLPC